MSATPLPPGTVLRGRFEIAAVLGRGGFSLAYYANDLSSGDVCVVKELAPPGSVRRDLRELDLHAIPHANPPKLRQRFLDEAHLIGKLRIPGILSLREAFEEHSTAYYVTDRVEGSRSLESYIAQEGRMHSEGALDVLFQLLETLEGVHEQGILHRDIKPTNILLGPDGRTYLIDFGAAREWHADLAVQHTVLFTPGYAPLEQLSEHGKRGPATDIYALAATTYHMLAGFAPRHAVERADGTELVPLERLRPDLDKTVVEAVRAGLQLRFQDRPQSVGAFRKILLHTEIEQPERSVLETFDATLAKLERFDFSPRECPACSGLLETPRPLRKGACPVCHTGTVRPRRLPERLCPACQTGILHRRGARQPLLFCPACKTGVMTFTKKGLINKTHIGACASCGARFEGDNVDARQTLPSESDERSWDEWRGASGRAAEAMLCDVCEGQYDIVDEECWRQVVPRPKGSEAYSPEEWSKIAAGLGPDAGNSECDHCHADFLIEADTQTLLDYDQDENGYGRLYLGKVVPTPSVPWLAVGKTSGHEGLLCQSCGTEFDDEDEYLRLAASPNARLAKRTGQLLTLEDWHRAAKALPLVSEEEQFMARFHQALREALVRRELPLDPREPKLLWRGGAKMLEREDEAWIEVGAGHLTVTEEEIVFSRLLKKWRRPLDSVIAVEADETILTINFTGEREPYAFDLEPVQWSVQMESGVLSLELSAAHAAEAIQAALRE
jgi:uncharacterized protein YbaR (Trm112 family)